jgi:hypothetical protein
VLRGGASLHSGGQAEILYSARTTHISDPCVESLEMAAGGFGQGFRSVDAVMSASQRPPGNVAFCGNMCTMLLDRHGSPPFSLAYAFGARSRSVARISSVVILGFQWFAKLHHRGSRDQGLHKRRTLYCFRSLINDRQGC